jgi:hypothetical protein
MLTLLATGIAWEGCGGYPYPYGVGSCLDELPEELYGFGGDENVGGIDPPPVE